MAVLGKGRSRAGSQAHQRLMQLYESAEHMRLAADHAEAQHGEASPEYIAALDSWNATLQYLDLFIHELVAASINHGSSSCSALARSTANS